MGQICMNIYLKTGFTMNEGEKIKDPTFKRSDPLLIVLFSKCLYLVFFWAHAHVLFKRPAEMGKVIEPYGRADIVYAHIL